MDRPDFSAEFDDLLKLYNDGAYERVVTGSKAIIAAINSIPLCHALCGLALSQLGQLESAIVYFKNALALDPDDLRPYEYLEAAFKDLGRYAEAAECERRMHLLTNLRGHDRFVGARVLARAGQVDDMPIKVARGSRALSVLWAAQYVKKFPTACMAAESADTIRQAEKSRSTQEPFEGLPRYLIKVGNAECIYPNIIFQKDILLDDCNGRDKFEIAVLRPDQYPLKCVSGESGALHLRLEEPKVQQEFRDPIGLLTATDNYSAWMLGELPRLALYATAGKPINLVLHGDAKTFHRESLAYFGIEAPRLTTVAASTAVVARELHLSTSTFDLHNMNFAALDWLRSEYRKRSSAPRLRRSVYISRSRLGPVHDRRIENEREVEEFLASEGFEIIHPQEMSFAEQAAMFASAKRIIAPFGAALASSIFCDGEAQVGVIATKNTPEFNRIFQWLRIDSYYITPASQKVRDGRNISQSYEFVVNLSDIRAFLAQTSP